MFRYFGYQWNPAAAAQAGTARQLDEAVLSSKGWWPALSSAGLRVHVTGTHPGINGVYPLPADRGVVLGRLFRSRDEASQRRNLEIAASEGDRIINTQGCALIDDFWGRYVAVLRSDRQGVRLLRDPSGALPCYRADVEHVAIFFSWLEDLIAFAPGHPTPRVDWEAVAANLTLGHLGGRRTALHGISQVLPGKLTPLHADAPPPTSLWSAVAIARKPSDPDPGVAATRLRQTVMRCTQAWSSCHDAILLRLSGGVDSAILLGSLSLSRPAARIACLNYHSPGADSDERRYARLAASKAGVELIEKERDAGIRLDDILAVSRTPTPVSYVGRLGTSRIDADVAMAHRARAMFTGGGGDQLFFQRRCTWPAADYLSVHGPGRGFIRASLDAARLGHVSLLRSMGRALADQRHRASPCPGAGQFAALLRGEAVDHAGDLEQHVHPDLLCASDLPIGKFNHVRELVNPGGYYDPYLRDEAPELVNPLLSQPLLELCLALPTWLLTTGGYGRALARRAFAGDIPREIAARQSKGGMEEHVATILHRNLPLARGLLLDGHLVRQGLLDAGKVEAALAGRQSASSAHIGEIHDYIAIEAWLQRFAESPVPLRRKVVQ